MKINISGRGVIPVVNALAPVRNVECDEKLIKRLLNYHQFRLYQASTGLLILKSNVDEIIKASMQKPVKKVELPKIEEPKIEEPVVESKIEVPSVEVEDVTIEDVQSIESITEPEEVEVVENETTDSTIIEETPVEETVEVVEEPTIEDTTVIETVDEDVVVEEATEEPKPAETEKKYSGYNRKKKNRH